MDDHAAPRNPYQHAFALPPGATEVRLVRHGSSATYDPAAPFGLIGGRSDPPLAPRGREQALRVGERLRGEPVTRLFVTPLQRTHETVAPLADALGLEPEIVDDLVEVHLGELETSGGFGHDAPGRAVLRAEVLKAEDWGIVPGAESMRDFGERVRRGLDHVVAATGPGLAIAVVHGGVIAQLCHDITGSRPFAFVATQNASITRLVHLEDGRRALFTYNDVAHLDGL